MNILTSSRPATRSLLRGAVAVTAVLAASAAPASAASFDRTIDDICKLYHPDGTYSTVSFSADVRYQGTLQDSIALGQSASLTGLKLQITIPAAAARTLEAFSGDGSLRGAATGLTLGTSNASPSTLNLAAPTSPGAAFTPVETQAPVTVIDSAISVGAITATGAVGSSLAVSVAATATSAVFDLTTDAGVSYSVRCRPNDYQFEDDPVYQDLTLVRATIINIALPIQSPVVTSLSPKNGFAGLPALVQVKGTKLKSPKLVLFGTKKATVISSSATSVLVIAPALPRGSYPVRVTTVDGQSATTSAAVYAVKALF
jgi:hypothetical protein